MGSLLDKKIEIPTIEEFIATERKAIDAMVGLVKNTVHTFISKRGIASEPDNNFLYPNAFQSNTPKPEKSDLHVEPLTPIDVPVPPSGGTEETFERFEIPLAQASDFTTITNPISSAIKNDFWKSKIISKENRPLPPPNDALINHANAILNGTPEIRPMDE